MALRQVPGELDRIGNTGECRYSVRHGSVVGGEAEETVGHYGACSIP